MGKVSFLLFLLFFMNTKLIAGCIGSPEVSAPLTQTLYPGTSVIGIAVTGNLGANNSALSYETCTSSNSNLAVTCNSFTGINSTIDLVADSSLSAPSIISIRVEDSLGSLSDTMTFVVQPTFYRSCKEIFDAGAIVDGSYLIDSDGNGGARPYWVTCDMTNEGGGWTMIYHHDYSTAGVFTDHSEGMEVNIDNLNSDKYSILSRVEDFKRVAQFQFRLNWSGTANINWWVQSSNPTETLSSVTGYAAIQTDVTSSGWGGLSISSGESSSLIDGVPGSSNWWFSIGPLTTHGGSIPGPSISVNETTLWVK